MMTIEDIEANRELIEKAINVEKAYHIQLGELIGWLSVHITDEQKELLINKFKRREDG